MFKNQLLNLNAGIAMDVKTSNYLQNLYASIAMDVKNQQLFMRPICRYCNGCKKSATIYKTYVWVLHI
jgi:hypothetical protein